MAKTPSKPKTPARIARWRQRKIDKGFKQVNVWAPASRVENIKDLATVISEYPDIKIVSLFEYLPGVQGGHPPAVALPLQFEECRPFGAREEFWDQSTVRGASDGNTYYAVNPELLDAIVTALKHLQLSELEQVVSTINRVVMQR